MSPDATRSAIRDRDHWQAVALRLTGNVARLESDAADAIRRRDVELDAMREHYQNLRSSWSRAQEELDASREREKRLAAELDAIKAEIAQPCANARAGGHSCGAVYLGECGCRAWEAGERERLAFHSPV